MNGIRTILWAVVCNTLVTLFMFRLLAHIFSLAYHYSYCTNGRRRWVRRRFLRT